MKKILIVACCVFLAMACTKSSVEKPNNLIPKDKMVNILYDISLIEAIKNQNIEGGLGGKVGNEYIYKKYKIDSLQFVKSNKYYASDIDQYKKMYEEVKAKMATETAKTEAEMKKEGHPVPPASTTTPANSDTPQVQ